MNRILIIPFLTTVLLPCWAQASTSVSLSCMDTLFNKELKHDRCVLSNAVTLGLLDEDMEASWDVSYNFNCRSHPTALQFDFGSRTSALKYTEADHPIRILEDGYGPLRFVDQDPDLTRQQTLIGDCKLLVHSVGVSPSSRTLGIWTDGARSQAKIIDLSLSLFELATDFKSYAAWDKRQTKTLLDSARLKVRLFEGPCAQGDETACRSAAHFRVIVGALEAKIQGTPSEPVSDETGREITEVYEQDLTKQVLIGRQMVLRFERWKLAITQELGDVLNEIKL